LRFYEAKGILRPVGRSSSGHRQYRGADILWLEFVLRLKLTGMPLADIRRYADLRSRGATTLQARLTMLKLHRERLVTRIDELSTCARVLDDKMLTYRKMIAKSRAPTKEATK
jgi:DNA-binding transcriptional MerR regulator